MFINYKMAFLNYIAMITLILMTILFQNVWTLGFDIPIYLWIAFIIYFGLYRKTSETLFMLYFITLNIASTSSLLASYLLVFNSLVLLVIFFFKRLYYSSLKFFSKALALSLLFYPLILWTLAQAMEGRGGYLHGILPWLLGALITWIFSFPLFSILKKIDSFTIIKPEGQKQPMKL